MQLNKVFLLFVLFSTCGFAQKELQLPLIEGNPNQNVCPDKWTVWEVSPDIISGNGPWPGGTYTMEDIDGENVDGGTMGLFLANTSTSGEGWMTQLTGLRKGQKYSISIQWQQCTLTNYGGITYKGGDLYMAVDSTEQIFKSYGGIRDGWQTATIEFVAQSNTAQFRIRVSEKESGAEGVTGSAVVIDNNNQVCQPCKEAGI